MTLCDQMERLYKKYGYYQETLYTVTLKGQDGAKKIARMMERIREGAPRQIGPAQVLWFTDYKKGIRYDFCGGKEGPAGLPRSNVLYFGLEGEGFFCIRPSGTEPKIKFYIGVRAEGGEAARQKLCQIKKALLELVEGDR